MTEKQYGRQEPTQYVVLPYTDSKGKEAIDLYNKNGKTKLLPWQEALLYDILAVNDEGLWTHVKYGYAVSRRNGKSEAAIARIIYGLVNGAKILYTSHSTDTSHDMYEWRVLPLVIDLDLEIASQFKAYGKEHIYLVNGGRIDFRTRTSTGRLGTNYDLVIIDEAQEYTPSQEAALKYVTTDSYNPQILFLGTPPTTKSVGTVFPNYRKACLNGDGVDAGWAEWSIDKEVEDVTDTKWWYLTNPSLGYTLSERNFRSEIGKPTDAAQKLDTEIQRLGLWLNYNQKSAITEKEWNALEINKLPTLKGKLYIGVKFGKLVHNTTLAIAVHTADGKILTEVIDNRPTKAGVKWIIDFVKKADYAKIIMDGASGEAILQDSLKNAKQKKALPLTTGEYIKANQLFEQAIAAGTLEHFEQASVTQAVNYSKKRAIGSGWGYETSNENADIGLIDAQVLAHYGAALEIKDKEQIVRY